MGHSARGEVHDLHSHLLHYDSDVRVRVSIRRDCRRVVVDREPNVSAYGIMKNNIYCVVHEDRHTDVAVTPFVFREHAIEYARAQILGKDDATEEPLNDTMIENGWIWYVIYGDGDSIRVVERELHNTVEGAQ